MASTSPSVDDESGSEAARERYGAAGWLFGPRGPRPQHGARAARRARIGQEKRKQQGEATGHGLPDREGLKPVLLFLLVPIAIVTGIMITGGHWPRPLLYGAAVLMGLWVAHSTLRSGELALACALFYLPFSGTYVIPLAPAVNGTNVLMLLALFASFMRMVQLRESWFTWPPGASVVFAFALLSTASGVTAMLAPGGYTNLLYSELLSYKGWIDQFLFYFIALSCVRDKDMAKRMVVYMGIGSIVLVIYAVPEMLDKMGRSTIEKSRIEGPHNQSNNFGGFVAYTLLPLIALFLVYIKDIRAWVFTPYFFLAAKILITTFSRGAYVALALGGLIAAYFKGRSFTMLWACMVLGMLLVFPQMIPTAILDRLESITQDKVGTADPETLDKSSSNRLILWRAAAEMIMEDPLTGKGFKEFPRLKARYTEQDVTESDPHSMYFYIGAQMGLPALVLFLTLLGYSFFLGRQLARHRDDRFIRAIGIGGAASTVCFAVICLFGSRAVNLEFTAYFWMYLVAMQVLYAETKAELLNRAGSRKRNNAFDFVHGQGSGSVLADGQLRQIRSRSGRRSSRNVSANRRVEPAIGDALPDVPARRDVQHGQVQPGDVPRAERPNLSNALARRRGRQARRR